MKISKAIKIKKFFLIEKVSFGITNELNIMFSNNKNLLFINLCPKNTD